MLLNEVDFILHINSSFLVLGRLLCIVTTIFHLNDVYTFFENTLKALSREERQGFEIYNCAMIFLLLYN